MALLVFSTLRGASRERVHILSLLLLSVLMVGIGAVESAEAGKRAKFILEFGVILLDHGAFVLSLIVAQTFILGTIRSRDLQLWLYRPISRGSFLLSRWIAGSMIVAFNLALIVTILDFNLSRVGSVDRVNLVHLLCISSLKAGLFLAMVVLLGVAFTPLVALSLSFLLGMVCPMLEFMGRALRTGFDHFDLALGTLIGFLPDFSHFDVRYPVVHGYPIPWSYTGRLAVHAGIHVWLLLLLASWVYSRRDL